ncbi:sulfotransferase [uncultured Cohaesibacter sp.]|uniref:sulfotransferase n=1 Tax=uncultured Cohaesibacter sp. TaxID=1002546 RepID=UPI00292DBDEE|nr:sulfotransferase [uncultured Cohaesibacter sp.]
MAKLRIDQLLKKAKALIKQGEIDEARQHYALILESFPQNKRAQQGLAELDKLAPTTRPLTPVEVLDRLNGKLAQGKFAEVATLARGLIEQHPDMVPAWDFLGIASVNLGQLDEAITAFKQSRQLNPTDIQTDVNLGIAYQRKNQIDEAINCFRSALSRSPRHPEAHHYLGDALVKAGKLRQAEQAFGTAIRLNPGFPGCFHRLGILYKMLGNAEAAIKAFETALKVEPKSVKIWCELGELHKEQGNKEKALEALNKALTIMPGSAEAHFTLSSMIKFSADDDRIGTVKALLKRKDLDDNSVCLLNFAMAKMQEDIGNLKEAFDAYQAAGQARQKLLRYDFETDRKLFADIKATSSDLRGMSVDEERDDGQATPIFILGMPRSGTTLVEQILSCHSQVKGAGELNFVHDLGLDISCGIKPASKEALVAFRRAYLEEVTALSDNKPFVTDKMPMNFLHVGLICSAFPDAKIIHMQRDAAAVCWSNFKLHFPNDKLGYSYDLKTVRHYYRLYQELMEHWHGMFGDRLFDFDYDTLVVEPDEEIRRLIDHLGLPWEEACLAPHKNRRVARTASNAQVRQEIYRNSSQAWKKFEPYLDGAFDGLAKG